MNFIQGAIQNAASGMIQGAVTGIGGFAGDTIIAAGNYIESTGRNIGDVGVAGRFRSYGDYINSYGENAIAATAPNPSSGAVAKKPVKPGNASQKSTSGHAPIGSQKALPAPSKKPEMKALPAPGPAKKKAVKPTADGGAKKGPAGAPKIPSTQQQQQGPGGPAKGPAARKVPISKASSPASQKDTPSSDTAGQAKKKPVTASSKNTSQAKKPAVGSVSAGQKKTPVAARK
ncbi:hypothetical protein BDY21DRAFT_100902 [Lineolata rhizophorae]|uniref:Uncharacterized protein n=1 Tax=Lineolata rhizophorae TaxID=578093 RepID=A0A6A6NTU7_9PEZI|nr:hypothetical protein BDY21DRAFT_100902 [Lineolata rhizophorae]